jgi:hypothetical protein
MTCDEARALFSDVADARLAPPEQTTWDAHLATCQDCRREWVGFQRTVSLLHGLPRRRAPAGFVAHVMAAARPRPWPQRLARRLFVPLRVKLPLQAAALVLVAVGAVYLAPRVPQTQQALRDPAPMPSYPLPAPAPQPGTVSVPPEPARRQPAAPSKDGPGAPAKPGGKSRADAEKAPRYEAREEPRQTAPAPEARAPSRGRAEGRSQQERVRTTAAGAPVVMGRLAVEDRDAAEQALAALVARLGATEVGRTPTDDGLLVELDVPRAQYPEFMRGLAGLGGWTSREERAASSAEVRVRVIVVRSPAR